MASILPFTLPDDTPVNIVEALSLAEGAYILSVDGQNAIRLFEGAAAPASRHGHPVLPGRSWSFAVARDPIWAWTRRDGTVIVVSEA